MDTYRLIEGNLPCNALNSHLNVTNLITHTTFAKKIGIELKRQISAKYLI